MSVIFKLLVSILVFNWICAEATLVAPDLMERLDEVTQSLAIPTHDTWEERGFFANLTPASNAWKMPNFETRSYRRHSMKGFGGLSSLEGAAGLIERF